VAERPVNFLKVASFQAGRRPQQNAMARLRTAVATSGFGMKATESRFIVFTKLSAIPLS
jgi:hypothetical protein